MRTREREGEKRGREGAARKEGRKDGWMVVCTFSNIFCRGEE